MVLQKTMVEAEKMAIKRGRVCYLYTRKSAYIASYTYWFDWIFKVYPGGKKQLSLEGTRLLEEEVAEDKQHEKDRQNEVHFARYGN